MKKVFLYIASTLLTGFTLTSAMPIIAGGCNSHIQKNTKIECIKDDKECQANKAEKYEFDKTLRS